MSTQEHTQEDAIQTVHHCSRWWHVADGQTNRWSGRRFLHKGRFCFISKRHLKCRCKSLNSQINSLYNKRNVPPQMQWPVQSPLWWIFQACVSPLLTLLSPANFQPYILFIISLCPCNSCTVGPDMTLHCVWFEIKVPVSLGRAQICDHCWYINKNFSFKL